jgi:hypothetical protein
VIAEDDGGRDGLGEGVPGSAVLKDTDDSVIASGKR